MGRRPEGAVHIYRLISDPDSVGTTRISGLNFRAQRGLRRLSGKSGVPQAARAIQKRVSVETSAAVMPSVRRRRPDRLARGPRESRGSRPQRPRPCSSDACCQTFRRLDRAGVRPAGSTRAAERNRIRCLRISDPAAVGGRIRRARERAGLSQRAFARSTSVTAAYVSRIENGERTPSLSVLIEFADQLETTALYLATGDDAQTCPFCQRADSGRRRSGARSRSRSESRPPSSAAEPASDRRGAQPRRSKRP
jgi:transcriptional regulator with XRE-family HTH domain